MEEVRDENWIPCLNEKCKNRFVIVNFDDNNEAYMLGCGFDNGVRNYISFLDDGYVCPYELEWLMCDGGIFKKRNDMTERIKNAGFKIEFRINEDGIVYIHCAERKEEGGDEKNI